MRNYARLFLLLPALLLTACDSADDDGLVCTLEARPGITVTVMTDGGDVPPNETLSISVREGEFEETVPVVDGVASLAYERAGTYEVRLLSDQSIIWTQSDVVVTAGECHVTTVQLTAIIEPGF